MFIPEWTGDTRFKYATLGPGGANLNTCGCRMAEADVSRTPTSLGQVRHRLVAFPIRGFWNFWLWLGGEALIGSTFDRQNPSYHETGANAAFSSSRSRSQKFLSFSICRSSHLSGLKRHSLTVGGMSRAAYSPANATALAVPSYNPSMVKSSIRMGQEQVSELGTGVTDAPSTGGIITSGSHTDIKVSSCENSIRE